jgi:hypothetical protein
MACVLIRCSGHDRQVPPGPECSRGSPSTPCQGFRRQRNTLGATEVIITRKKYRKYILPERVLYADRSGWDLCSFSVRSELKNAIEKS